MGTGIPIARSPCETQVLHVSGGTRSGSKLARVSSWSASRLTVDSGYIKTTWLLEAKWTSRPTSKSALSSFQATVESKSAATRGLFISVSGYSSQALAWLVKNQRPAFLMLDGDHLRAVLEGKEQLDGSH
jgi:hypothetical protein